ncbi:MAG: hypothetical protein ACRCXX_09950 [Cetobacterium sp.]|uniref:hypothetical protein n=1 Tax=Cetobacterium sp. TaxID=2071632 RepID=UPI003F3FB9AB
MSHMITMEEYEEQVYATLGEERKYFHHHASRLFIEFLQKEFGIFKNYTTDNGDSVVHNPYSLVVNGNGEYILGILIETLGSPSKEIPVFYSSDSIHKALTHHSEYTDVILNKLKELDAIDDDLIEKMSQDYIQSVMATSKLIPPEVLAGMLTK